MEIFLRRPELIKEKRNLSNDTNSNIYLYEYGVECDYFIIILDGEATVQVGKEGMEIKAGLFSFYGLNALIDDNQKDPLECIGNESLRKPYKPEFSLRINSYCVYMQITRAEWKLAVKNSIMERNYGIKSPNKATIAPINQKKDAIQQEQSNKIADIVISGFSEAKTDALQNDLATHKSNSEIN